MPHPSQPVPFHGPTTSVVGILGGVGSGKSTVARGLGKLGALVLDADEAAARVLEDPAVAHEIHDLLGAGVVDGEGRIIRAALAQTVFGDGEGTQARRQALESIVHPRVRELLAARLREARGGDGGPRLVVLDVPLLMEGPILHWCDRLVFVEAPAEARQDRTARHRGWERDEVARREAAQASLGEKRARADLVIHNDGTLEELEFKVADLWRELVGSASRNK